MKFLDMSGLTQVWDAIKDRFQTKLVSGTNIKTINGESILTSGNIDAATQDWVNEQGFAKGSFINANGNTLIGDGTRTSLYVGNTDITFQYKDGDITYLRLGTNGDIAHDDGTGWIECNTADYNTVIQGGQINIHDNGKDSDGDPFYVKITPTSISLYMDDYSSTENSDSYVRLDKQAGVGVSGPNGLGFYQMDEQYQNTGSANIFWSTNGGQSAIEPLAESEILEILV